MITKVEVRTTLGELLTLSLEDVTSGVIVKGIEGLNPVKATIVSSSFAMLPGAQYQGSNREPRYITLKLGLEPDYNVSSVSDLRMDLYNFFLPQTQINLRIFMASGLVVNIDGMVEDFAADFFVQEPEVSIPIICFLPDLLAVNSVSVNGATVSDTTEMTVSYPGNISTGFSLVLNVNRSISAFTVYNKPPDNSVRSMDFAASLVAGDVVTISTVAGSKSVTRTRSGVTTSLLYSMSTQSPWIELMRGDNLLRVYAVGAAIPYTITYTAKYGGL